MSPVPDDLVLSLDGHSADSAAWDVAREAVASAALDPVTRAMPDRAQQIMLFNVSAGAEPDRWAVDSTLPKTSVQLSDLMVLGEALRILTRLQSDGVSGGSVGDAAALGRATIQMVLDEFM